MLTELLQYLRNWFVSSKIEGEFTIKDGQLTLDRVADGQYIRIVGSALNDGVWQYPVTSLRDEAFSGTVWRLNIPPAVVALAEEITDWQSKFGDAVATPWQSESYSRGSYSRSKGSGGDKNVTWQTAFADRLAPWRKL